MPPLITLKFKSGKPNWFGRIPLELICWVAALIFLAMAKPAGHQEEMHVTFCPLANLGIQWCPGCGLGRAITHLFHGHFKESFAFHWFGIPALLIICYRIIVLVRCEWKIIKYIRKEK